MDAAQADPVVQRLLWLWAALPPHAEAYDPPPPG